MEDTEAKTMLGVRTPVVLVVLSSIVFGGLVFAIGYLTNRFGRAKHAEASKNEPESNRESIESQSPSNSERVGVATGATAATSGKRAKNKKRREAQQEFTHSWMVGALKGHTAPVLDINFAGNGKFLASCAEDCGLVPEEEPSDLGDCSSSSSSGEFARRGDAGPPGAAVEKKPAADEKASARSREDRAILSRRQRKNRTRAPREQQRDRDDDARDGSADSSASPSPSSTPPGRSSNSRRSLSKNEKQKMQPGVSAAKGGSAVGASVGSSGGSDSGNSNGINNHDNNSSSSASSVVHVPGCARNRMFVNGNYYAISKQRRLLKFYTDAELESLIRRHVLSLEQRVNLGYPVESANYPGYAIIINHQYQFGKKTRSQTLSVNAREFVPAGGNICTMIASSRRAEYDSGNGSGSSVESSDLEQDSCSDSDKNSDIVETKSSSSSCSSSSSSSSPSSPGGKIVSANESPSCVPKIDEIKCVRCSDNFYVNRNNDEYLKPQEKCFYHWGKRRESVGGWLHWECCQRDQSSRGCATAQNHVWTGLVPGWNGPFDGYARTLPRGAPPSDGSYGVYAIDCEMCYTKSGLEPTKVTVVDMNSTVVYDTLVKPSAAVIDYNTRFSGITSTDLANASKTLVDVQRDLLKFISAETIIIGHGLENDLRALRLVHPNVIDTCIVYPHRLGYPFRNSLKTLAWRELYREIQTHAHDSVEDARIAADLMLRKIEAG